MCVRRTPSTVAAPSTSPAILAGFCPSTTTTQCPSPAIRSVVDVKQLDLSRWMAMAPVADVDQRLKPRLFRPPTQPTCRPMGCGTRLRLPASDEHERSGPPSRHCSMAPISRSQTPSVPGIVRKQPSPASGDRGAKASASCLMQLGLSQRSRGLLLLPATQPLPVRDKRPCASPATSAELPGNTHDPRPLARSLRRCHWRLS